MQMDPKKILSMTQRILDNAQQQMEAQEATPEELSAALDEVQGLVRRYIIQEKRPANDGRRHDDTPEDVVLLVESSETAEETPAEAVRKARAKA